MKRDTVVKLLEQVASGQVSVEDARAALEGVELDEDTYISALDHGVFNEPDPGTIVRASMSPTGESALVVLTFVWGLGWTLYWAGATTYGLFAGWDQQLLSFFFGMATVSYTHLTLPTICSV